MAQERTGDNNLPVKPEPTTSTTPQDGLRDWFSQVQTTFQSLRDLGDLRDRQKPLMRLHRDILLGELRSVGVVHVAEQEANSILRHNISYFKPGAKEIFSTEVHGRVLDLSKPDWFFMLHDVGYDHDNFEMEWKEGLKFSLSRTLEESTAKKSGIWATTEITYSPSRYLIVRGEDKTYEEKLGFPDNGEETHFGMTFPYPGVLIYPPENFDLEKFKHGLKASLTNPKKFPTKPKQQNSYLDT